MPTKWVYMFWERTNIHVHIRQKQTHKFKYIENNVFYFRLLATVMGLHCHMDVCFWLQRWAQNRNHPSSVYPWFLGSRRIQGIGCTLLFDDLFFLKWLSPPIFFFFSSFCCVTLWFNVLCYLCMSRKSGKWLLLFDFIFVCRIFAFVCCAENTGMRLGVEKFLSVMA